MSEENKKSLIAGLWDKKVPQYLGTYFAVGFGLLQFVQFLTDRYNLSGNILDKYLLVWLSLIPAIALLIYFGKQFRKAEISKSLKWLKVLVIGNVVASFLLGGFLFNDKSFGQSKVVELTDEEGKKVKAIVPILNKVKTVAVFQFENGAGNEKEDWWGPAFSQLLALNLEQRPEFYSISAYSLNGYYDALGLRSFAIPNVGMQRKIAQQSRNDYFTRISFTQENDSYIFKGDLYESSNGKKIIEINAEDNDPYIAIDKIKEQIVKNIPNPIEGVENETDLPASSLISGDKEALRYFTQSRIAFSNDPSKLEKVVQLAKKAVDLDPSCAMCHYYVGDPLYGQGRRDESNLYLKNAVKYATSLPERMQFSIKQTFYSTSNKMSSYIKLLELQRRMYPYDFQPYKTLVTMYKANYGIDSAKALIREAIDNGNREKGLLTLYSLQLENEEYNEAEKTLDRFSTEFPSRDQDRLKYATIYEKQGRLKEAKEILLNEEAIDPLNAQIQTRIAYLDYRNLDFNAANKRLEGVMEQATSLTDSLSFLWTKLYFLRMSGQIDRAFDAIDEYQKYAIKQMPLNRLISTFFTTKADMYQSIGEPEKIKILLTEINKYNKQSGSRYNCMANTNAVQRDYKTHMNENEFRACGESYKAYGEGFDAYFDLMNAYQAEDYKQCIAILDKDEGRIKKLFTSNEYFLVNIFVRAEVPERAEKILKKAIDQKTDDPLYYYQMAVLLEKKNPKASKKYLNTALQFWENADDNYIPLQRAKELENKPALKT